LGLLALAGALLFTCKLIGATFEPIAPGLAWWFDIAEDETGTPSGSVHLMARGQKVTVTREAVGGYQVIPREEFTDRKIPKIALAACSSWWAGAGEEIFIVRESSKLLVYKRLIEEGLEPSPPFRLHQTIPLK
jgi:hypothetical protein